MEGLMPKMAHNFAADMKLTWGSNGTRRVTFQAEENAIKVAARRGAKPSTPVSDDYEPGKIWIFPDGSDYIIGDNGGWIAPVRNQGRPRQ
jgi:hypothetical protein